MEPPPPVSSFDPALLASHVEFTRRLARGLVRGPGSSDDADDVAAQALAAAVAQRPETGASFRGWLRRVVTRLARRRVLADEHRLARERLAAHDERTGALPGADELASRIELERELAVAFASLEEPARSTLYRRYWLDLTPTQIATETATPLATVKSRLQRGLAQLRERLDAEHGGRREEWMGALVRWSTIGGTVMAAKSKVLPVAIAAIALLGATVALLESSRRAREAALRQGLPVAARADAEAARANGSGPASDAAAPEIVALRAPDPAGLPFAAGIVVDGAGAPLAEVRVLATRLLQVKAPLAPGAEPRTVLYEWPQEFDASTLDAATLARSGADGRFAVPAPADAVGSLRFAKEGFGLAIVRDFDADPARNQELRVTLAPERRVHGTVRESDGRGLARAAMGVLDAERNASSHQPRSLVARHLPGAPEIMAAPEVLLNKARCDADGRFDLRCVPDRPFEAFARADGFSSALVAAAALPDPWEPTLVRSDLLIDVVDATTGAPIIGAGAIVVARTSGVVQQVARSVLEQSEQPDRVGLESRPVGRLVVDVRYPHGGYTWLLIAPDQTVDATIHVAAIGYHSATVDTPITAKVEPQHLRVELVPDPEGRAAPSIAGRVVGPPDAEVALFAVPTAVHGIDDSDWLGGMPQLVAKCGADGAFAFPELPPARYLLLARSKECAAVRADVTAPCRDVGIELATAVTLEVAVVASDGAPVAGAIVQAQDASGRGAWIRRADEQGVARFEKLPAGTLRALAVAPEGEASSRLASPSNAAKPLDVALFAPEESIEARPPADGAAVRLVVHPVARRPVRVVALHDDGSPAPAAKYEYSGASQGLAALDRREAERLRRLAPRLKNDARGETTFDLYPGEHWFLATEGIGRESEKIVVPRAGDATVTFRLPDARPNGSLRGRVVELGTGASVAGRDVKLFSKRPGTHGSTVGTRTTDREGAFAFEEVPRGDVVLWIEGDRIGAGNDDDVRDPESPYGFAQHDAQVEAGVETTVAIELAPIHAKDARIATLPFTVVVKDAATGSLLPGAVVDVYSLRGATRLFVGEVVTDAAGRGRLDVLADSKYRVYAAGPSDPKTLKPSHQFGQADLEPRDGVLAAEFELRPKE